MTRLGLEEPFANLTGAFRRGRESGQERTWSGMEVYHHHTPKEPRVQGVGAVDTTPEQPRKGWGVRGDTGCRQSQLVSHAHFLLSLPLHNFLIPIKRREIVRDPFVSRVLLTLHHKDIGAGRDPRLYLEKLLPFTDEERAHSGYYEAFADGLLTGQTRPAVSVRIWISCEDWKTRRFLTLTLAHTHAHIFFSKTRDPAKSHHDAAVL